MASIFIDVHVEHSTTLEMTIFMLFGKTALLHALHNHIGHSKRHRIADKRVFVSLDKEEL